MNVQFTPPYSMLLVGSSISGKTFWLAKLLEHIDAMHTVPIAKVIYCFEQYQPCYDSMRANCTRPIEFVYGPPTKLSLPGEDGGDNGEAGDSSLKPQTLLIMDDMMTTINMESVAPLFLKGRHPGINPVLVLHNLTHRGRNAQNGALTTINRNCSYRVLFSIPSDMQNVRTLQTQMFPHLPRFLIDAYQDACCSRPYGYLVLDSRPTSDNNARAYTQIWPGEETEFYLPPNHSASHLTIPGNRKVDIHYAF